MLAWRLLVTSLLSMSLVTPVLAAEILVRYAVFEDLVREAFFDTGDRHYLMGSEATECRYAYLTGLEVGPRDGRLQVRMVLNARTAARVVGRCVGPADSLFVTMSGVPRAVEREIVLDDIDVEVGNEILTHLVAPFLRSQLPEALRFPVQEIFSLRPAEARYVSSVSELSIVDVSSEPEGLRLELDLALVVGMTSEGAASP